MSQVREAVKLLEMALPSLPTGGEGHKAAIDSLKSLSKAFPASEAVPGVQNTALLALQQKAQQDQMLQAVMRQRQQAGAQGGAAPGGGATPQPAPQMAA